MDEIASYGPNEAIQNSKSNMISIKPKFVFTVKWHPQELRVSQAVARSTDCLTATTTTILHSLESSQFNLRKSNYFSPCSIGNATVRYKLLANVSFTHLILRVVINLPWSVSVGAIEQAIRRGWYIGLSIIMACADKKNCHVCAPPPFLFLIFSLQREGNVTTWFHLSASIT